MAIAADRSPTTLTAPSSVKRKNAAFRVVLVAGTLLSLAVLAALLVDILSGGWPRYLQPSFYTEYPSRLPARAGIRSAILGTVWLMGLTAAFVVPVGVGAAIYLEEFAPRNRMTQMIETNIANLAGVPSIIYGLLGLGLFVRGLDMGRVLLAGALTLGLLVLPIVIIASREALRSVPAGLREGALALGATPWQAIRREVLPAALPGMLTGTILALSRAIGETAPLITIGAFTFIAFDPNGVLSAFTALPIQVLNWTVRPQQEFHVLAAAASVVLVVVLLGMNAIAIWLRNRYRREW